jgi:DNA-directed RNA polymerase subunit RPC12/RpoP
MKLSSKAMKKMFNAPFEYFEKYGETLSFEETVRGYTFNRTVYPDRVEVQRYIYKDNGSSVLAVAHLDTVNGPSPFARLSFAGGDFVLSARLDDRLGAYIILDILPKMGIVCDWLLTEGEESCHSSASLFVPTKKYNWAFSFDRAGTDAVLYQYEDESAAQMVLDYGWDLGIGSYSDIADLDIGAKCLNFGTGYYKNHSKNAYANLDETRASIAKFARFYQDLKDKELPHKYVPYSGYSQFNFVGPEWEYDTRCSVCGSPLDEEGNCGGMCPDCAGWEKSRDMYVDCPHCGYPVLRDEYDEVSERCVFCIRGK